MDIRRPPCMIFFMRVRDNLCTSMTFGGWQWLAIPANMQRFKEIILRCQGWQERNSDTRTATFPQIDRRRT